MKVWDIRIGKVMRSYKVIIQQILDILFFWEGFEFLSSIDVFICDLVDCIIIVWDFWIFVKIFNQIFYERFICFSFVLYLREFVFLVQINGNYLVFFFIVWFYWMSRWWCYEGYKVEGYLVGCECFFGGDLLVMGSVDGWVLMYSFCMVSWVCMLQGYMQVCVGIIYYFVLFFVFVICFWGGDMKIWY